MSEDRAVDVQADALLSLLVEATCCRTWPVFPLLGIGRCGYCGQRPKVARGCQTGGGEEG